MPTSTDYILDIAFDADRTDLAEQIETILFLSQSTGSTVADTAGEQIISAYFDTPEDRQPVESELRRLDGVSISTDARDRVDWLSRYQQSLHPLLIGNRFVVVPDERLLESEHQGRLPIIVPQEHGFGTGSHETTALCLHALESLSIEGGFTADIGTGSGILALAMLKLGARAVVAFDNDFDTIGLVTRNLLRNAFQPDALLQFFGGVESMRGTARFYLITMNIVPEVIVPLLPQVAEILADDGSLIVSGILSERADWVVENAAESGLRLASSEIAGEWWCGRLVKS